MWSGWSLSFLDDRALVLEVGRDDVPAVGACAGWQEAADEQIVHHDAE